MKVEVTQAENQKYPSRKKTSGHFAQVYEDRKFLSSSIAEYIRQAIASGSGVLILAEEENWKAILQEVSEKFLPLDPYLQKRQVIFLNASTALARISGESGLDPRKFLAVTGALVSELCANFKQVRCYMEVGNLLCQRGQSQMAGELEHYWSSLLQTFPNVTLMCGYSSQFSHACQSHSHVIEGDGSLSHSDLLKKMGVLEQRLMNFTLQSEIQIQTEQELSESFRKLEQAGKLATIGGLYASIAHELNNPLGLIKCTASVLKSSAMEPSKRLTPEGLSYHASVIDQSVEKMSKVIQGVLGFARQSDSVNFAFSLRQVVVASLGFVSGTMQSNYIQIVDEFDSGDFICQGSSNQISQVLVNLLLNAKDAVLQARRNRDGFIRISAVTLSEREVAISIADNGIGMNSDIQSQIFEPFFTTKENGMGVGLGLSISQEIMKKHRGRLEVKSQWGQGTQVLVVLPRSQSDGLQI